MFSIFHFYLFISVVAAKTSLQNFVYASFWSLPIKILEAYLKLTSVPMLSLHFIFFVIDFVFLPSFLSNHKITSSINCNLVLALPWWYVLSYWETNLALRKCIVESHSEIQLQNCVDPTSIVTSAQRLHKEIEVA